jgi:hypothetical protein
MPSFDRGLDRITIAPAWLKKILKPWRTRTKYVEETEEQAALRRSLAPKPMASGRTQVKSDMGSGRRAYTSLVVKV